ncbi:MAG TPA: enoyl-CoA hydratase-related protein [Usitatibacter sp.]|nr:enoyl-CoA hydratase-related protein [Usitatibacter sp.]
MSDVRVRHEGAVTTLVLDRPRRRNALTWEMYDALDAALAQAEADDSVRAIALRGTDDTFTAGNDLEDFLERPPAGSDAPVFRFLARVAHATKPLVAAVNGPAIGLGTTVLLHCDLVFAGESARFQLPFVRLGLVPEFASTYLLPLAAGPARAAELLLLGEAFDAHAAHEAGIVTQVVPDGETFTRAAEAAAKLAALPAEAVRATKSLLREPHRAAVERQLGAEGEAFREMLSRPAAREALAAFLARRAK